MAGPFVMALAAAICIVIGLLQNPGLYPVDYGQYKAYLANYGLNWTAEDLNAGNLQFTHPVISFAYTHFSWMKLFTPAAAASTVYAIAVVRAFGFFSKSLFQMDALAFVWGLLLVIAVYMISFGLYRIIKTCWFIPGIILCLLYTDGNFCAILRGLYPQAAVIVFALLAVGSFLVTVTLPYEKRNFWIILFCIVSILFVKADTPMVVFIPGVVLSTIILLVKQAKQKIVPHRFFILILGIIIVLTGCRGAVKLAENDRDYISNASMYESVFNTFLPAASEEEQKELLNELSLDLSYQHDIGKSFYEEESSYVHDPRNADEAEKLFAKLSIQKIIILYVRHPKLFEKIMSNMPGKLDSYENQRNMTLSAGKGYVQTRTDGGMLSWLRFLLPGYQWYIVMLLAGTIGVFLYLLIRKKYIGMAVCLYFTGMVSYLPFCVMTNGYSLFQQYALSAVFFQDCFLICGITVLFESILKFQAWVIENEDLQEKVKEEKPALEMSVPIGTAIRIKIGKIFSYIGGNRKLVTVFTFLLALLMLLSTYMRTDHPGCVNNGDFGRMMAQLGITWTGDMYYNTDSQMSHQIIEEYEWDKPFDWKKLTPLEPTYTLYFFVSLVRMVTEPFGQPLNTWYLALLMGGLTILCITIMTYDLYPLLKKYTIAAGVLLCTLFMGEVYLTWYNSLFGESCILIGMILSLTCALHLCMMKVKSPARKIFWYISLGVSLYIMMGAKAQMLMSVPFAAMLLLIIAWYRRPYRYDFAVLMGIVAVIISAFIISGAFGIFRSDRTSDSVSEKHTLWQAYFYGIFMISDDPIADMKKLGIDTKMAADIGKYVNFADDSQYVYAPLSQEAQTAFYDHVSTFTILQWYISHPDKLYYMLDHAAKSSQELYTGFRVYKGQDYSNTEHDAVDGLGLWQYWRSCLMPNAFWEYIIIYLILFMVAIKVIFNRSRSDVMHVMAWILLFIMGVGIMQYPMTVLGNGFADNQKQLFGFSLCQDCILVITLVCILRYTWRDDLIGQILSKRNLNKKNENKQLE